MLILAASTICAQDTRKLSRGGLIADIPNAARIESAGRVGAVYLAVWGTTEPRDTGNVPVLMMQIVRGGTPVGTPRSITPAGANPNGFVQVLPLRDRFMVFWNDRVGGVDAARAAVVDTAGVAGSVWTFAPYPLDSAGVTLNETSRGMRLLWNRPVPDDSIVAVELRADGSLRGRERGLAAGRILEVVHPAVPGGMLVLDRGAQEPLVIDQDGEVHRPALGSALSPGFFLDETGRVVTYERDTARVYRSLLDTIPERKLYFPINVDGLVPNSVVPGLDGAGRVMLTFVTGSGVAGSWGESIKAIVRRVGESTDSIPTRPVDLSLVPIDFVSTHHEFLYVSPSGSTELRFAGNRYVVRVRFASRTEFDYQGEHRTTNRSLLLSMLMHSGGAVATVDSSATLSPFGRIGSFGTAVRARSADSSVVDVVTAEAVVRLAAPAAMKREQSINEAPGLAVVGGEVVVAWIARGFDTTARLGIWREADGVPEEMPSVSIKRAVSAPNAVANPTLLYHMFSSNGRLVLACDWNWLLMDSAGTRDNRRRFVAYAPTALGWAEVMRMDTVFERFFLSVGLSVEPYSRDAHVAVGTWDSWGYGGVSIQNPLQLIAIDTLGTQRWRHVSTSVPSSYYAVPVARDDSSTLIVTTSRTQLVLPDATLNASDATVAGAYLRLIGDRYVRVAIGAGSLTYQAYNLKGAVVGTPTSEPAMSPRIVVLAQNPRDSGVAVVYSSGGSVRVVAWSKDGIPLHNELLVTGGADSIGAIAAVFHDAKLRVAWQEFRGGVSEIFGSVVAVKTSAAARDPREGEER